MGSPPPVPVVLGLLWRSRVLLVTWSCGWMCTYMGHQGWVDKTWLSSANSDTQALLNEQEVTGFHFHHDEGFELDFRVIGDHAIMVRTGSRFWRRACVLVLV